MRLSAAALAILAGGSATFAPTSEDDSRLDERLREREELRAELIGTVKSSSQFSLDAQECPRSNACGTCTPEVFNAPLSPSQEAGQVSEENLLPESAKEGEEAGTMPAYEPENAPRGRNGSEI